MKYAGAKVESKEHMYTNRDKGSLDNRTNSVSSISPAIKWREIK
jgi:hypothetical protein